jgi:tetratricopeptide (TPR) repeat protein
LWQVPLFVVGVAALAAVLFARPFLPKQSTCQLERDLRAVRHQLEHGDGDLESALVEAQRALEIAGSGDRAAEAQFLLGSVHLRLAAVAEGQTAQVHNRAAREHLEEAGRLGVADSDRGVFQYRLGKAGYYTGDDRNRVAVLLAGAGDQSGGLEERADCLGLLVQTYLELPQPNLPAALKINEQIRQLPVSEEKVLAPARLQAGEIYLRMQKPDEARKVLEKVGRQAPAAVLTRARILRAQSFQNEGRWSEAAPLWKEALADPREVAGDAPRMLYNLGVCHARLSQPQDASRAWEECVRTGHGDEAAAAALSLAETRLGTGAPDKALEALTRAVEGVKGPGDWKNMHADLNIARQVCERAVLDCRLAHRYDLALRAVALYERLAPPGRAAVLQAESAIEWARARRETGRLADLARKKTEEEAACELFRQAGEAYTRAYEAQARPIEGLEQLWLAAACFIDAGEHVRAAGLLERFLAFNSKPERAGEGWYRLGEARRQLGSEPDARKAYRECIKHPTAFAFRARYQLAQLAIKNGELDEAEAVLEQNLKLLRFEPDSEAQEKSLFALGNLFYQRRNYRMVVRRLEEALGRFPVNAEATRAHLQLADSYSVLAAEENDKLVKNECKTPEVREHVQHERRRWLRKAVKEYLDLAEVLEKPEAAGHLSAEEAVQVPFKAAECFYNDGQFEEALRLYEQLAGRYPNRVERLNALGGMVRCLAALGRNDKIAARLAEIQTALAKMDPTVKTQWEEWLRVAGKPLAKP